MSLKPVLIISVGLNIVLALFLFRNHLESRATIEAAANPDTTDRPTAVQRVNPVQTSEGASGAPMTPTRTFTWELVESPDYREYIANLRAIGCPEETIRDIILADVNKLYAAKKKAARGEPKRFEYWKATNPMMGQLDPEYLAAARKLEEEKIAVLRQLGIEPDIKVRVGGMVDTMEAIEMTFGFLPEDKQVSVMDVMQDMQAEMVKASEGGAYDGESIWGIQRKMEQAIKELLTPEEFREYELRMSMTANTMRSQLTGWDPDEQEFLKVYDLRKAFDDEFTLFAMGNESEEERNKRADAQQQLNDAIKQALGATEYAKYERAQDWNFQQTYQAARRVDLGMDEAVKVYDMKQAAESEANRVRMEGGLTEEQRRAALEGIQAETERSIKQVLGDKGWEQYNRGPTTHWLRNLAPNPSGP